MPPPPNPPPTAPPTGLTLSVQGSYTILVTDDDTGSRQTLASWLKDRGFTILEAKSGEEAIEIVRFENVHLLFTDMHMPRMTGLEALQQVRLINELLPAILVTADVTRDLMKQALQAQVYSVIPKPVNKNVVMHTMLRALQKMYGVPVDPPPTDPPAPPAGE
jgi:CheY-like chemotaxis protein